MDLGSTFASAMARASSRPRSLIESLGSPLPRVSSGTPLPRNLSGTSSAEAWAGAWTKFLDSNPDTLPSAEASWGSMTALNDLDKVVGLPPASASAQALAPTDLMSVSSVAPPPSPVPPVPPRAIASVHSTRNGAPRTSAGPPLTTKTVTVTVPTATARTARAVAQPVALVKAQKSKTAQGDTASKTSKTAPSKVAPDNLVAKTTTDSSRKRKTGPSKEDPSTGLSKEEIQFRKKRTKIETPTYIPEEAIVAVPSGGLATGTVVETELQTGQIVKLTISASDAAASTTVGQLTIKLDTPAMMDNPSAQYKVKLRGGRIQWVSRKKLETILRNRRSAAATRNTTVELRLQMDSMLEELKKKDDQIASLKRMLEKAGVRNAENAKTRLLRTLSGGLLQTRAAPWY